MTLVVAWRSEERLTVCADTRITAEDPITNAGQKLFLVPVEVTPFGIDEKVLIKPSVGFAFAGNTLLAQSCCAIASTCLSSLGMEKADAHIAPDVIANFFAKSAEYVSQERRFIMPRDQARFHSIVFGWDEAGNEPFVFEIEVSDEHGALRASSKRADILIGGLAYFGSGADFIRTRLEELEAAKTEGVHPYELIEAAIADADLKSVGGSLQFATAEPGGVRLRPMMRVDAKGAAEISILGCDIRRLVQPSGPIPGSGAVALPTSGL